MKYLIRGIVRVPQYSESFSCYYVSPHVLTSERDQAKRFSLINAWWTLTHLLMQKNVDGDFWLEKENVNG